MSWISNEVARVGGRSKGKVAKEGTLLAPVGGSGQRVVIGAGGRLYGVVRFQENLRELAEKAGWDAVGWAGVRRAIEEARLRGNELLDSPVSIRRVYDIAINQGVDVKYLNEKTWPTILGDLAKGELFEEVKYEATEVVEHEEGTGEVIYVGDKKHTPKKAKEGARRAMWAVLHLAEAISEEAEVDQYSKEAEVDQEGIIFGDNSGNSLATMTEGAWQRKIKGEDPIFLDDARSQKDERARSPIPTGRQQQKKDKRKEVEVMHTRGVAAGGRKPIFGQLGASIKNSMVIPATPLPAPTMGGAEEEDEGELTREAGIVGEEGEVPDLMAEMGDAWAPDVSIEEQKTRWGGRMPPRKNWGDAAESTQQEVDVDMEDVKRKAEGLAASRHAPSVQEDEEEEGEGKEEEREEDTNEEMAGADQEEKPSGLELGPGAAEAAVITLGRLMQRAAKGKEMGFWKGKRARLCEEAMRALGSLLDLRVEGERRGWKEAIERAENTDEAEYMGLIKKEWAQWRDALNEKKEAGIVRMAGELAGIRTQMAVLVTSVGVANAAQEAIAKKEMRKVAEEKKKREDETKRNKSLAGMEVRQKRKVAEELRDEMRLAEATKLEEAQKEQEEQRKLRLASLKLEEAEKAVQALKAKGDAKAAAEAVAREASEKVEKERRAIEAAERATVPASGTRWMVAGGKKMRKLTVIALIKQRFVHRTPQISTRWDDLISKVNNLLVHAESQEGAVQLFRVSRMTCNAGKSMYERRIEIVEGRWDLTDEEVIEVLVPQLKSILGDELMRCWVEGTSTVSLVARGVPVTEELSTEDKLGKVMKEENPSISLGFRDPVRLGGQALGGAKATVVRFEVYEIEDAIKLIKEGIKIGGKMRTVEEFKGQPRPVPQPAPQQQRQHQQQQLHLIPAQRGPTTLAQMRGYALSHGSMSGRQVAAAAGGGHQHTKGARCMGCPTYRTGGIVHGENECPLRNGNRGQKRTIPGAEYPQWPRTNAY